MTIDFYSYSGIGGRPVNEDSIGYGANYFIVSDGLGGHDNGEIASRAAIDYIENNFTSDISNEAIANIIVGADEAVRTSGEGGKATLAAIFSDGNIIRVDNIGDSRVYFFRRGRIYFRTKDHSVCQASVDMGQMTDADVRKSEDRSGLFKVLGDSTPLKLPKPYETIDPLNNDAFLICSDGFWEHVYEAEMEADLLKSSSAKAWMTHMLKRVLLRSENEGDNFSAICGIIHQTSSISRTISETDEDHPAFRKPVEITPPREEVKPEKPNMLPRVLIAVCALLALAALIVIIVTLASGGKTESGTSSGDNSVNSAVTSSTQSSSDGQSDIDVISGSLIFPGSEPPSEISDPPETSENPSEPETSSEPETPSEPDDSDTPDPPFPPIFHR